MNVHTYLIPPGAGTHTRGFHNLYHKVQPDQLGGSMAIAEGEIAPGEFIPPHTHSREDEVSHIIRGELTYRVGDETLNASAGAYVIKPRGIPHAFWNGTREPVLVIEIHSPGAFVAYYDAFGDLPEGPERAQAMLELQRRFGLVLHVESALEIARENGLRTPFG